MTTQPSLFDTPHARKSDPQTSHSAGKSVQHKTVTQCQQNILLALKTYGPLTDERIFKEVHRMMGGKVSASGVRTRRNELVDFGSVKDSGKKGKTESGRDSILWEVS